MGYISVLGHRGVRLVWNFDKVKHNMGLGPDFKSRQHICITHYFTADDIGETFIDESRKSKREPICTRGDRRIRELDLLAVEISARLGARRPASNSAVWYTAQLMRVERFSENHPDPIAPSIS